MAKIIFEVRDREANHVTVETAENDLDKLLAGYDQLLKKLQEAGFTPIKARGNGKAREKVKFDGKLCPVCKSPVYDNRTKKQSGEWKATAPDFTCSNKQCTGGIAKDGTKKPWAVWPDQYEIVPTT